MMRGNSRAAISPAAEPEDRQNSKRSNACKSMG
jgi:hypothetical protein